MPLGFYMSAEDRKCELVRPAVSNVDQVMLIFACTHPEPNTGLIDRFLINMERQEMDVILVISKVDLQDSRADQLRRIYTGAGYQVIMLSNQTGEGLEDIRECLRDRTTVLSGPSGVGKSSLINSLIPEYAAETGDISRKLGKGRNTTRHTEIVEIEGMAGSFIIDTPGYSSVELLVEDERDIRLYMREFRDINETCRFAGCVHMAEPGCSVKARVDSGLISGERYIGYTNIYNDIKSRRKW